MRSRRFRHAVIAVLVVSTAGCGGAPAATEAEAVAWTNEVCATLTGFTAAATAQPRTDPGDPAATVEGLRRYLGATAEELQRSLAALDALGPSPVEGGDQYVTRLRVALRGIQDGYRAASTQLAALDTTDPHTLRTAYPAAVAPLRELEDLPDPTTGLRTSDELRTAIAQAPGCRGLRTAAPPPG